jgi:hypothetical protein
MSAPIYSSPVIVWGTSEDFSTWSQTGTVTATSGQVDPFGGTTGYVLDDNDAAAAEARYKEYTAAVKGYHVWTICSKFYSATTSAVKFENTTLAISGTASYAWSAYEATLTAAGNASVLTPAWVGGYYIQRIIVYAAAGNTMRMTLYPAGTTVGDSGATYFYQNDLTLLGVPDNLIAWEEPREGSAWVQGGSGVEDAWIQGTDYRMTVTLPWVPFLDRASPEAVSGWGGPREYNGVNCGISAMLRAGRTKATLTWYPNLYGITSSTATAVASYLVDPMRGAPTLQPNGDRSVTLDLRNASTPYKPYETV